tara:strand:- start:3134 stop:3358 length:225 start_codon:yes stop_codon:yes gene_type:complete
MTAKKKKKMKLDGEQIRLAQRYEKAWHKLFYECNRWKQTIIIEEPHGRHADEFAKDVRIMAESEIEIEVSGKIY